MLTTITTSDFKNIFDYLPEKNWEDNNLKNKQKMPCILEFGASWCGPCRNITPILEDLSNEYKNINFYNIDVDEEYELSKLFNIRSIPTLLFIPINGQPVYHTGTFPKTELKKFISKYFGE